MVGLDKKTKAEIIEAIREAEAGTSGEIRVHVKRGPAKDALDEAQLVFRKLGMHRTRLRNGVLIFLSWKSRSFAIVGDEGIHRAVGGAFWDGTRDRMQAHFSKGELGQGILAGVRGSGKELKAHFPVRADDRNELPNRVTEA